MSMLFVLAAVLAGMLVLYLIMALLYPEKLQ